MTKPHTTQSAAPAAARAGCSEVRRASKFAAPNASMIERPMEGRYMQPLACLQADLHDADHRDQHAEKPEPASEEIWMVTALNDGEPGDPGDGECRENRLPDGDFGVGIKHRQSAGETNWSR